MIKNPDEIINNYREAIRLNYGDERANKSYFHYRKGWYYFELAKVFRDGSCGVITSINGPTPYRAKDIIKMTQNLMDRVNEKKTNP